MEGFLVAAGGAAGAAAATGASLQAEETAGEVSAAAAADRQVTAAVHPSAATALPDVIYRELQSPAVASSASAEAAAREERKKDMLKKDRQHTTIYRWYQVRTPLLQTTFFLLKKLFFLILILQIDIMGYSQGMARPLPQMDGWYIVQKYLRAWWMQWTITFLMFIIFIVVSHLSCVMPRDLNRFDVTMTRAPPRR